ncbi:peptide chain release factor N(5)-glutamine methyltransferase [Variovorax sp. RHLX14]|uniref:peptide chain release factor N(5)-glutamine methyltransferase n=1 Tax=Variovorax sp. RHLX14 TaxID=1259731 RepID=UPI003F47AE72
MPSTPAPSTVAEAQRAARTLGLDRLDAQLLLLQALGRDSHDRAWLISHDADPMPDAAWHSLAQQCVRRVAGEPVAYLLGEKEFHGLALRVDARVLVPRPDTETLVDWALDLLREHSSTTPSVLDLGTGSGAIALALKHARPDLQVDAVDASVDALAVAQANSVRLGLDVRLMQGNWLDGIDASAAGACYDLIVSNPPYIAEGDPHLPALGHEPLSALVAGADGLDDIRRIVRDAPSHLRPDGRLLLEHGHDQADAVCELLAAQGFVDVVSRDDLAGIARCSGGRWQAIRRRDAAGTSRPRATPNASQ